MAVAGLSLQAGPSAESVQLAGQVLTSALSLTTDQLQILQADLQWLCRRSPGFQQAKHVAKAGRSVAGRTKPHGAGRGQMSVVDIR